MKISRTAIFLFELMFVILIFTVATAVCSALFAKAYSFSTRSHDLPMAMLRAESAAEDFKAGGGAAEAGGGQPGSDTAEAGGGQSGGIEKANRSTDGAADAGTKRYYDKNWKSIAEKDGSRAVYILRRQPSRAREKEVSACEIEVSRVKKNGEQETLIRIHVKRYEGGDTGS